MNEQTTRPYDAGVFQAQDMLPYRFRDRCLLQSALTAGDTNSVDREGHRGLAQLGDQLIGFVLMSEGFDRRLSRQEQQAASSHYRRKDVCSMLAKARHLDRMVKISDRQMHDGPQPTVLKNTLAAIIGAVWADSRDYVAVRQVMACLGLINYVDFGVEPSKLMLAQPASTSASRSTCVYDAEVLDWSFSTDDSSDMVCNTSASYMQPQSDQWGSYPCCFLDEQAISVQMSSDISMRSSSPVLHVCTPASSTDDRSFTTSALQYKHSASTLQAKTELGEATQSGSRPNGFQQVIHSYLGREMTKLGSNRSAFDQHYCQISEYQQALQSLAMPAAQKKVAAKMITAVGDSSALLMLKRTLLDLQSLGQAVADDISIAERLELIFSLECSADNTRLVHWLHLCELIRQLSRQVDAENSGIMHQSLDWSSQEPERKIGNPQNHKQSRISQLIMLNIPPEFATESMTKRLRRMAQRLLLLVEKWKGYGVLALLGAGFNSSELMILSDGAFKQMVDLVWSLEGERLSALSQMAESVVGRVRRRVQHDVVSPLEYTEDDHILSMPRLSYNMGMLLTTSG